MDFLLFDECTPEGHFTGDSSGMRATTRFWFWFLVIPTSNYACVRSMRAYFSFQIRTKITGVSHRWSKDGLGSLLGNDKKESSRVELESDGLPFDSGETLHRGRLIQYSKTTNRAPRFFVWGFGS